jgi:hypothetical protein
VIDHLIAPIVFRLVFGGDAVTPALAARLVDELFVLSSSSVLSPAPACR